MFEEVLVFCLKAREAQKQRTHVVSEQKERQCVYDVPVMFCRVVCLHKNGRYFSVVYNYSQYGMKIRKQFSHK